MKRFVAKANEAIGFTIALCGMSSFDEPTMIGFGMIISGAALMLLGETMEGVKT